MVHRALALLLISLHACATAAEVREVSLLSRMSWGTSTATNESIAAELTLRPAIDIRLDDSTELIASARLRVDAKERLEPGRTPVGSYSVLSKPLTLGTAGSLELRDLYIERRLSNGVFRLGKQQVVWGRLDGIKVLDVVNPQEFREFILEDFDRSRIGLWSAYLDVSLGSWRTELVAVPDSTTHVLPDPGAWFELTAPRFRFGSTATGANRTAVVDQPGILPETTAAGLRLSRTLGRFDVSLVAHTGLDFEPLGRITTIAGEPALEQFHARRTTFGVSAESGLGNLVFRTEVAVMPGRRFNARDNDELTVERLDQYRAAIGLDYRAPFDVFVNLQYLLDTIDQAPASLVRPETDRIATLYLQRRFGLDRFEVEFRWYHAFEDRDDVRSIGVIWRPADNTSLHIEADRFSGSSEGLFGQFDARDRVMLRLEHLF